MASICVAMSGGVDSSVAALLLKQRGHDVAGVTLRLLGADHRSCDAVGRCCSPSGLRRARDTCALIDIPHFTLDAVDEFAADVIDPFCDGYSRGLTPNPCNLCNERIKFGLLLQIAVASGFDAVASGHYAQVANGQGRATLMRAADAHKDQSYALCGLQQAQLRQVILPLAKLKKSRVRRLAAQHGLPASQTPDSQDLCFAPGGEYRRLVPERATTAAGPVYDTDGQRVGIHPGLHCYTIGQRRGLNLNRDGPYYVVELDPEHNAVVVGPRHALPRRHCTLADLNWVSEAPKAAGHVLAGQALVRYNAQPTPARIVILSETCARVTLPHNERTLTPGQPLAFYRGNCLALSGVISDSWN